MPSQKASTSSIEMPALATASDVESMSIDSVDRSQCSPNSVHPIPTMATRSRIPREPTGHISLGWTGSLDGARTGRAFQK